MNMSYMYLSRGFLARHAAHPDCGCSVCDGRIPAPPAALSGEACRLCSFLISSVTALPSAPSLPPIGTTWLTLLADVDDTASSPGEGGGEGGIAPSPSPSRPSKPPSLGRSASVSGGEGGGESALPTGSTIMSPLSPLFELRAPACPPSAATAAPAGAGACSRTIAPARCASFSSPRCLFMKRLRARSTNLRATGSTRAQRHIPAREERRRCPRTGRLSGRCAPPRPASARLGPQERRRPPGPIHSCCEHARAGPLGPSPRVVGPDSQRAARAPPRPAWHPGEAPARTWGGGTPFCNDVERSSNLHDTHDAEEGCYHPDLLREEGHVSVAHCRDRHHGEIEALDDVPVPIIGLGVLSLIDLLERVD